QEAALTVRGEIAGRRHDLDWPALVKHTPDLDVKRWYVLATPIAVKGDSNPYGRAIERARAVADEITAGASSPISVTLTGRPLLGAGRPAGLSRAVLLPALVSSVLIIAVLGFGLARPGLIAVFLLVLALAFMTFAGAAALIAPRLDRVTV